MLDETITAYKLIPSIIMLVGGGISLYLLWGAIQASVKLCVYVSLIVLLFAILYKYDVLPEQFILWLNPQKFIQIIQERFHYLHVLLLEIGK